MVSVAVSYTHLDVYKRQFQSYAERLESTGDKSDKETALEYRASIADLRTLTEHLKAEINEMEIIQPEGEG